MHNFEEGCLKELSFLVYVMRKNQRRWKYLKQQKRAIKKLPVIMKSINEVAENRDGGIIALTGFHFQTLYSIFVILEFIKDENTKIKLEGIEDIDKIESKTTEIIEHIQLKYSKNKQSAEFMKSILKNYLEIYLFDKKNKYRFFKLVYDCEISNGNLEKMISNKLDDTSRKYWNKVIDEIKAENKHWDWNNFITDEFIIQLKFEKRKREDLILNIEKKIIERYEVNVGNERLYAYSLSFLCFNSMKNRECIDYFKLEKWIQDIKDDINKGEKNPAYQWIEKIDFDKIEKTTNISLEYYNGKKAEPRDIVNQLPVKRIKLENEIEKSIDEKTITVIKSSSGQGKTTLAWQVSYNQKSEYSVYKLNWCNDVKEVDNIVEYFKSRIKVGEKLLIVLDNLDIHLKKWNILMQQLSSKIGMNYKVLVTTREEDWYSHSGNQANLSNMKIVDISLTKTEAQEIYNNLKKIRKINSNNWQTSWELVSDKGLLIEYIYLLTHGEMIRERVSSQIKEISNKTGAKIKLEFLRLVTLADILGIKLPVNGLIKQLNTNCNEDIDINELLKSIENEFYIKISDEKNYIEGLHPIRSYHISNELHANIEKSDTILKMLKIVDEVYISKLYSQLPKYIISGKDEFYRELIKMTDNNSYTYFLNALKGLFSGSITEYFVENKSDFDNADKLGGLELLLPEISPFNYFEDINYKLKPLTEIKETFNTDQNIQELFIISEKINKFSIKNSDFYYYSYYLYQNLTGKLLYLNKNNYANLASLMIKIDNNFDLITKLSLSEIWQEREIWEIDSISELFYCWYIINKTEYIRFTNEHKNEILLYLKIKTNSIKIYEEIEEKKVHIEYLLTPDMTARANNESVNRLNLICKILPIYDYYCADTIKPEIDILNSFKVYDDSHKEIQKRNIVISYNFELNQIWQSTIRTNYEVASLYEWLLHWIQIRQEIVEILRCNFKLIEKILQSKKCDDIYNNLLKIGNDLIFKLKRTILYPMENRPFEKPITQQENMDKFKGEYFRAIRNYINQMLNIIHNEKKKSKLALHNLKEASGELKKMQVLFNKISDESNNVFENNHTLCEEEAYWINKVIALSEYFLSEETKLYLNFNNIVEEKKKKERKLIEELKKNICINSKLEYIFPINLIQENNFIIFPLIVKNIVHSNEIDLGNLYFDLVSIFEKGITIVKLFFCNESNLIKINGMNINSYYIESIKEALDAGNEKVFDNVFSPLPILISDDILSVFTEKLVIEEQQQVENLKNIDTIYLKLWEYSQYGKYLSEENEIEKEYCLQIQNNKKNEIEDTFKTIKEDIPIYFREDIENLKTNIINKKYYLSDSELNKSINKIIEYLQKK